MAQGTSRSQANETPGAPIEPPTGEPIVLGMANMEGSPQGSVQDARLGAEAAIAYINRDLGGVHGRPVVLETRITQGSPESSVSCARELVALKPVAFVGGADFFAFASLPIFNSSGIPVVGGPAFGEAEITAPNTYKFAAYGAANWPAMAIYAIDELSATKIALIYPDNVPGNSTVEAFLAPTIEAKGAQAVRFPFAPDTKDFTSTVASAIAEAPDAIIAIGPTHACRGLLTALKPHRGSIPLFTSTVSIESSTVEAVGEDKVVGVYTVSAFDSWGDGEDAQAYRQAIKQHVGREELDEIGVATFSGVMNLYSILEDLEPTNITPEAITAALQATKDRPSFMGHPYTCNGEQLPGRPAVCDCHTRVLQVGKGLRREFVTGWVNHSHLIPPRESASPA